MRAYTLVRLPLALCLLGVHFEPAMAQGAGQLKLEYDRLKSLEGRIPLPTPHATLRLGDFAPLSTSRALPRNENGPPVPRVIKRDFRLSADAVNVTLQFFTSQRSGPFSVTIDGKRFGTTLTGSTISANIGRAQRAGYSVLSGTSRYSGLITIARPPIIGAGVFTIKALPVAIIYAPPQTHPDKPNVVTYRSISSVGTSTSLSFSEESATTRPETPSQFADVGTAKSILSAGAAAAKSIPKVGGVISGALSAFADGLGSASASSTAGKATVRNNQLTLEHTIGSSFGSTAGLGPGEGDRIVFLRNARLMWVVDSAGVRLAFLGADRQSVENVGLLKKAAAGQASPADMAVLPDRETIQDLLKLDPFMGGSRPTLPPDRFAYVDTYTGTGTGPDGDEYLFEYRLSAADSVAKTSNNIRTEDFRSGFLSFVGLGVTQTKSTKTTISHTSLAATTNSQSISTTGRFHAAQNQRYAVEAYYDRAFGTFCFVDAATTSTPSASGVLTDSAGKPIANQIVTIQAGKKRFATRTDSQGRYAFFSTQIKPGAFTLKSGTVTRSLSVPPR